MLLLQDGEADDETDGVVGVRRIGGLTCAIRLKTKLGFNNFTVRIGELTPFSGL